MTREEKMAYRQFLADYKVECKKGQQKQEALGRWHKMPLQVHILQIGRRQIIVCLDETILYADGKREFRGRQTSFRFSNKYADAHYTQSRLDKFELAGLSTRLQ